MVAVAVLMALVLNQAFLVVQAVVAMAVMLAVLEGQEILLQLLHHKVATAAQAVRLTHHITVVEVVEQAQQEMPEQE